MPAILQRGQTIPDFTLDDIHGNSVSSRSYYMRRNLIVVLLPHSADTNWNAWLNRLARAMRSIPENDAACLVVVPGSSIETITGDELPETASMKMLVDSDGRGRARFDFQGTEGQLLITDRFGVIFHTASGPPDAPELKPEDVPGWIEFIACRCS